MTPLKRDEYRQRLKMSRHSCHSFFPPTARRRHMQVRGGVVRAERSHAGQERQTL